MTTMAAGRECPHCNSKDVEHDDARGETICCGCGAVLEEGAMVEGLQFMESSGGSVTMVGQFVPSSGSGRSFGSAFGSRESREQVLHRGYGNLQKIADHLRLSNQHVESAQRVFLMAVQRNFTVGRNNLHVASACLYTICRRERTPHMLIDFSDVLQTPVRTLGQVFMKLLRLLHIQVPHVDPSLFMERFASQMNLGDKMHAVASTGVRLIQAMTRDWISTGRRPTGLCGAALLISARYHEFQVNASDISHIVRISSPTLMKRLSEFKLTSTAQLTASEFETTDLSTLPVLMGPPCLEKNKRQQRQLLALQDRRDPAVEALAADASSDSHRSPLALPALGRTDVEEGKELSQPNIEERDRHMKGSSDINGGVNDDTADHLLQDPQLRPNIRLDASADLLCKERPTPDEIMQLADSMLAAIGAGDGGDEESRSEASRTDNVAGSRQRDEEGKLIENNQSFRSESDDHVRASSGGISRGEDDCDDSGSKERGRVRTSDQHLDQLTALLRNVQERADDIMPELREVPRGKISDSESRGDFGKASGCGGNQAVSPIFAVGNIHEPTVQSVSCSSARGEATSSYLTYPGSSAFENELNEEDDEDDDEDEWKEDIVETLSDVDDDEIKDMLLGEEERKAKALIWDEMTKDVMPDVYRRLRERKRKQRDEEMHPNKRRRQQKRKGEIFPEAISAADSVRMALEKNSKGIAGKINSDVLDSLFNLGGPRIIEE